MQVKVHQDKNMWSEATFSDCSNYRYRLTRVWDETQPKVNFIMLNPSKADEVSNDPTVERCQRRAQHLGFGAFRVTNIFAWRDTDPMAMRRAKEPVGPLNDEILCAAAEWADQVIVAWGVHGAHQARGRCVADLLSELDKPLYHLGLSKDGHPRHPLYLPYSKRPEIWSLPYPR